LSKITVEIERRLRDQNAMLLLYKSIDKYIENLTEKIFQSNGLTLKKIEQVITEMVHSRGLIKSLIDNKINLTEQFDWVMQLKY